jgi:hypothetical protein
MRGGRCRLMLFPPPWFPPSGHPPSRGVPLSKRKSTEGGNPSWGTQHGSLCVVVTPPCGPISAATIAATESGLGLPPPRRRLANPPRPPVNVPHTGRFSSSPLCECRSASGGVGSVCQPARLQRTRSQPFAERRRVKPPVCFLLSFDKLRAGSSQRLHAPAADPLQGNPRARFPWATCFNPSAGSGFKPAANPSPIAVTTAAMGRPAAAPAPQPSVLPDGSTVRPFFCYCKKTPALRFKRKTPGTFRASMPLKRKSL